MAEEPGYDGDDHINCRKFTAGFTLISRHEDSEQMSFNTKIDPTKLKQKRKKEKNINEVNNTIGKGKRGKCD